jgi:hypothetical protein
MWHAEVVPYFFYGEVHFQPGGASITVLPHTHSQKVQSLFLPEYLLLLPSPLYVLSVRMMHHRKNAMLRAKKLGSSPPPLLSR